MLTVTPLNFVLEFLKSQLLNVTLLLLNSFDYPLAEYRIVGVLELELLLLILFHVELKE